MSDFELRRQIIETQALVMKSRIESLKWAVMIIVAVADEKWMLIISLICLSAVLAFEFWADRNMKFE